ncbi:cellulase family glycosylhydrolase [Candidatus Chloroploca sp. M-50]|uniref:Cellulase family glycosylhydrolase n=1 Tax=Candidatus Chloroploca mongolica TaxID=2528176 RepID=A0ABS4D6V8_9CHLR|nr:cellulase family glycosylhydrolase [Candidatus Chloroploca mongolica]MBP1465172.1 cellulase family glycosylhydrolase [Candidatus Chloroploca mongolica]
MAWYQRLLLVSLVLLIVVGGAAATLAQPPTPAQSPYTLYFPVMGRSGATPIFGIETWPNALANSDALRTQAANLGATWVRLNSVRWDLVQPEENGPYNWAALQNFERDLAAARQAGVTPTVIIRGSPRWATIVPSNCAAIKDEAFPAYAAFVEALVSRYRDQVQYWEFGNEPDIDPVLLQPDQIFGCWGDIRDPYYGGDRYGRMLKAVAPAVRRANPQAQIILGGLLLDRPDTTDPTRGKPERFFEGVLRAGAADSFDIVAFHGYPSFTGRYPLDHDLQANSVWTPLGGVTLGKARFLREVMSRYGVDKPLWLNETSLLCTNCSDLLFPTFSIAQADHVVRVMARAAGNQIDMVAWYTLNGPGWRNSGLLDGQNRPRPVFIAMQHMIRLTRGYQQVEIIDYGQPEAIEGYRFTNGPRQIDVLWSRSAENQTVSIPVGQFFMATSLDGVELDESLMQRVGDEFHVTIGFTPIFIERRK